MTLSWLARPGERLPAVLSALLLALSFPPLHPLVLPFVGLVPLAVWLQGLRGDGAGRRAALRGGFLFGVVYFGLLFYWIPVALALPPDTGAAGTIGAAGTMGSGVALASVVFAVLAFAVIVIGLAAMAAAFAWTLHDAVCVARAPLWLALPVTWTALEWARAHLPSTLALPWLGLGTSLTGYPELVGVAEVIGARGVTFWIATVNALVAGLVVRARGRQAPSATTAEAARTAWAGPVAGTLAVALLPMLWGVWRADSLPTRPVARVAVVQPDMKGRVKTGSVDDPDSAPAARVGEIELTRMAAGIDSGGVDLVVLPEGAVRTFARSERGASTLAPVREVSRRVGAPVLFGALGSRRTDAGDVVALNSAFLMEPEGLADFQYDKHRLVPVVERLPFIPARWTAGLDEIGAYGVGEGWPLARAGDVRYGILICYESSYADASRALRLAGADVLVNITNDAWFGGEPPYLRTSALWQHPAHLVMRAIENRVGVVRSANTGASLFIDPVGRTYQRSALFSAEVGIAEVRTTDVVTLYTRFGDLAGNVSALAVLGLLMASLGTRRDTERPIRRLRG